MKISIIIPAHNEEENIAEIVRLLLAQEYADFEVIVVDNASTDNTALIARQFPIKVVHERRKGILFARERGRQEAKGDIIANIDADCRPDKDWLSRGASHFTEKSIAAVTGPCDFHDTNYLFRSVSLATQKHVYRLMSEAIQSPFVRSGAILIGGNNFIRSEILKKIGGYNTKIIFYGEDTDTAKRIRTHGKIVFSHTLIMKTSGRRFKKEGVINTTCRYFFYFFKTMFLKTKR